MATLCSDIIARAQILLQDSGTRWPTSELLGWINEAFKAITLARPDATMKTGAFKLTTGTSKQKLNTSGSLITDAIRLRSVVRNLGVLTTDTGRAIRPEPQRVLDDQIPTWHSQVDNTNGVQFYVHDPMNPLVFYIYPHLSVVTWHVEVVYTAEPVTAASSSDAISVDEAYVPAVLDYVCYRAYSKDAEYTANAALAQGYYQRFMGSLQVGGQSAAASTVVDSGKVTV